MLTLRCSGRCSREGTFLQISSMPVVQRGSLTSCSYDSGGGKGILLAVVLD